MNNSANLTSMRIRCRHMGLAKDKSSLNIMKVWSLCPIILVMFVMSYCRDITRETELSSVITAQKLAIVMFCASVTVEMCER